VLADLGQAGGLAHGLGRRLETLNPLYCGGLWLAVTMTPPAQSRWLIGEVDEGGVDEADVDDDAAAGL
jgi:hypothetical protein